MPTAPETTISITGCLREISDRLTDAAAVAKAVSHLRRERLRASGGQDRARHEMLHEANTLLNGVTLLNRMRRPQAGEPEPETG